MQTMVEKREGLLLALDPACVAHLGRHLYYELAGGALCRSRDVVFCSRA